jgi:hypothetical protein
MKNFVNIDMNHVAASKNNSSRLGFIEDNKLNLFTIKSKNVLRYRFDFEVGYLIKSPCRECQNDNHLPGCADDCDVLEKIQTLLAEGISCTRRF